MTKNTFNDIRNNTLQHAKDKQMTQQQQQQQQPQQQQHRQQRRNTSNTATQIALSEPQKHKYSIGNMNVLKTAKSNRVLHNNENINETCVILTF